MPGLVPGIHGFLRQCSKGVHGRDKPGHDKRTWHKIDIRHDRVFKKQESKKPVSKSPRPVSGAGLIPAMLNIRR
jgi:hypothetical protein